MTEATVGQWFKKPGDAVNVDEPLLELETDQVTLEVPARLRRLLQRLDAQVELVSAGDRVPDFDFHLPLVSAPCRLGFDPDREPAEIPYLTAEPGLVASWAERLPPRGPVGATELTTYKYLVRGNGQVRP